MAQHRFLGYVARGALGAVVLLAIWMVAVGAACDPGHKPEQTDAGPESSATRPEPPAPSAGQPGTQQSPVTKKKVQELDRRRLALDQTVWKQEVLAQAYEEVFIDLWDTLRAAPDQLAVLAAFPFTKLSIGQATEPKTHDWGIEETVYGEANRTLDHQEVVARIDALRAAGFVIVETEWHHAAFEQPENSFAKSIISMTLHVTNTKQAKRLIVRGKLHVTWAPKTHAEDRPVPNAISVADLKILARGGDPVFEEVFTLDPNPQSGKPNDVEPLLLYDLDRNGLSEIILAGANQIYWNQTDRSFARSPLCSDPLPRVDAAIIAEFTGDAFPDLIVAGGGNFPRLYLGGSQRVFEKAKAIPLTGPPLVAPSVITAGDVDGDGDLDVWIGQYKRPYVQGQMPTPFYDANDGFPSYLLINDGAGNFTDQTEAAGLVGKRLRRTYASSFFDFDGDGDLDLLVTNDFAGVDLYYNNGRGQFEDVTDAVLKETRTFGMSHTFADYDLDGGMDVLVVGMSSTTARRLEAMGLGRDEYPEIQANRMRMGYGNRVYLGGDKGLAVAPFNADIARTGWSWGSTSFDFDLDGDRDIYIANGHSSGKSSKDYCTTFWRHDIYNDPGEGSEEDAARAVLYKKSLFVVDQGHESWNGYEHNVLLMNEAGRGFLTIGFLMGAGLEQDSRSVVSDDVDGDGRPDLLVVTQTPPPEGRDTLRVLRNTLSNDNRWIGVRLYASPSGKSPQGADVTIHYDGKTQHQRMVTGDSYRAQHAPVALFGIGESQKIDKLVVRWAGGLVTEKTDPVLKRYHLLTAPDE